MDSLQPGDFLEATIEHVIIPRSGKDYYGPNKELQTALAQSANTWQMVAREANENSRGLEIDEGTLLGKFPDIRIATKENKASFSLSNGLGFVPVTFTNLTSHKGYQIQVDGKAWHQTSNKKDFWQTDFDPITKTWSQTYNLPFPSGKATRIQFGPATQ